MRRRLCVCRPGIPLRGKEHVDRRLPDVPPFAHTVPSNVMKRRLRLRLVAAMALFPALAVATSGCLGYPADGLVATPTAPSEGAASRLPQLLSQLQGGSAGLELFDGTTNEVLGEQDGSVTPSVTAGSTATRTPTPSGQKEPGTGQTPLPSATYPATVVVYPTSLPLDPGVTPTATPTPDPTTPPATVEPTATPTATPTVAPTEIPLEPTPTATIPTEGGPPTE